MRSIHIDIVLDDPTPEGLKLLGRRISRFVNVLMLGSSSGATDHALKRLEINVQVSGGFKYARHVLYGDDGSEWVDWELKHLLFPFEGLVKLRGVPETLIRGFPDSLTWFAQCLMVQIAKQSGAPDKIPWQDIVTKSLIAGSLSGHCATERHCQQPKFNWKGFANRNNIAIPSNSSDEWARAFGDGENIADVLLRCPCYVPLY